MDNLTIEIPDRHAKGFLRRQRSAIKFQDAVRAGDLSLEVFDELIDFLLGFVVKPAKEEARDILLDASEADFEDFLEAVKGGRDEVDPPKSEGSDAP